MRLPEALVRPSALYIGWVPDHGRDDCTESLALAVDCRARRTERAEEKKEPLSALKRQCYSEMQGRILEGWADGRRSEPEAQQPGCLKP